jgi:transposase
MEYHAILFVFAVLALKSVKAPKIDQLRDSVSSEDQRAFIKINVLLGTAPQVVFTQLETAVPQGHLSRTTVYDWYKDFKEGRRTDTCNLPKPGRPREATNEENQEMVRQLILEGAGMRTEDLLYETQLSHTSLWRILQEKGAIKLKSRWIPHELTARQQQSRMNIAGKHLARYQREQGFLNKIVAIDETWLKSYDPEDSRQSSEWQLPGQKK